MLVAIGRFHRPEAVRAVAMDRPREVVLEIEFPAASPGSGAGSVRGPTAPSTPTSPAGRPDVVPMAVAEPGAAVDPPGTGATAPALRAGFRDARLFVDPKSLTAPRPPPLPVHERMVGDVRDRIRAEPDSIGAQQQRDLAARQVTIMGRGVTVFGDPVETGWKTRDMNRRPQVRKILPVDGRVWQELELGEDRARFERDSILRARARGTRDRVDAARRAAQTRP